MTTSTGTGGADYSSGFDLNGNAASLGLNSVQAAWLQTVANGAASVLLDISASYVGGKLRLYDISAGAEDSGTPTVDAGSVLQLVVLGTT